jgi:uncharacterized protein (DUF927 family)
VPPFFSSSQTRGFVTDFLNSVLPTQGVYCTVGIRAGSVKQAFHNNTADVEAVGSGMDSSGVDAYFALATFKDSSGRKADNAVYLRSFFLDLDCGTGKPYVDQPAAAQALSTFVSTTGLPSPTIVNSGGGIHVYWPLADDISVADWLPKARALKRLCAQHNLYADPVVTTDAARILRIPGTHNFKTGHPRPVQIIALGAPSELDVFSSHLPPSPVDLSAARQYGMDVTSKELAGGEYPKCDFARIARRSLNDKGCAQVKFALTEAATLEEPLWRAVLSIAHRCEDGEVAIHKISKPHPGYTPADTEAKARETKGPYTCDWYRANYSDRCKGCAHRISSPILLGRTVEAAPVEDDQYIIEKPEDEETPAVMLAIPVYPTPYFRGINGGVYMRRRTDDGDEIEIEIYPYDLYLTERFYDSDEHGDGDGEMVGINLHMRKDGVRRFYTPVTTLFTKDKMRDLLIKHGVVAYGKQLDALMAYFASTIRKLQTQYAANKTRSQMGWTPDMSGFVVGELEYTVAGTKLAPPASGTRQLAASFRPTGSLEEWKKIVNFYDRPGLEPHAFTFFAGLGSCLLKILPNNTTVKGAMIHLKNNGSGSGKSTAQMVVNSIFGHPDELLMKSDDTPASKMHMLGMLNSIALTIDEITNTKPEVLSDMAYGFTSGRGRHRMEQQSNRLRSNQTSWCNVTLTSGNASVVDILQQLKNTSDGELRRVLEIAVPAYRGASKQEIDAVFGKLNNHFGIAGPIFIKYILENLESVKNLLAATQGKIDKLLNLDQTDRFYSSILTIAFTAAQIGHQLGLHDINIKRIFKYASVMVSESREATRVAVGDPLVVASETLASFINENVNNALVAPYQPPGDTPKLPAMMPKGQLKMRYDPESKELAIPISHFREYYAKRQVDVKDSLLRMTQAGLMKHGGNSHPTRIGAGAVGSLGGVATRCYIFDGQAIGVDRSAFVQDAPDT